MAGGRLDFDKVNRASRLKLRGFEPVDDLKGPSVQPARRPEDVVSGAFKAAQARTKVDREELAKLEELFALWMKAPDISSIEIDKLRRKIKRLKAGLPTEKKMAKRRKFARQKKATGKRIQK